MLYKLSVIAAVTVALAQPSAAFAASRLLIPQWYKCDPRTKDACYIKCVDTKTGYFVTIRVNGACS
jgi:hypothetical protein